MYAVDHTESRVESSSPFEVEFKSNPDKVNKVEHLICKDPVGWLNKKEICICEVLPSFFLSLT